MLPAAAVAVSEEEPFWLLPSTRANYAWIEPQAMAADASPAAAAVAVQQAQQQMRRIGGRLAKQTQKASSGIMQQARDLGQNIQARTAAAAAASSAATAGGAAAAAASPA